MTSLDRDRLVENHRGLVYRIANRLWETLPPHVELDDLVGDGFVGLLDAATRYDPTREVPFINFAYRRVRGAMLDGLRALDQVPRLTRQRSQRLLRAIEGGEDINPYAWEVQGVLDPVDFRQWPIRYLEDEVPAEMDFAAPEDHRAEDALGVEEALAVLTPNERRCCTLVREGLTHQEIASVVGLTPSRVSQISRRVRDEMGDRLLQQQHRAAEGSQTIARLEAEAEDLHRRLLREQARPSVPEGVDVELVEAAARVLALVLGEGVSPGTREQAEVVLGNLRIYTETVRYASRPRIAG